MSLKYNNSVQNIPRYDLNDQLTEDQKGEITLKRSYNAYRLRNRLNIT